MIHFLRGVFQTRSNVIVFQIGKIFEDFCLTHSSRQQIQDIPDPDTHPSHARASSALLRVESDPRVHDSMLTRGLSQVKITFFESFGSFLIISQPPTRWLEANLRYGVRGVREGRYLHPPTSKYQRESHSRNFLSSRSESDAESLPTTCLISEASMVAICPLIPLCTFSPA